MTPGLVRAARAYRCLTSICRLWHAPTVPLPPLGLGDVWVTALFDSTIALNDDQRAAALAEVEAKAGLPSSPSLCISAFLDELDDGTRIQHLEYKTSEAVMSLLGVELPLCVSVSTRIPGVPTARVHVWLWRAGEEAPAITPVDSGSDADGPRRLDLGERGLNKMHFIQLVCGFVGATPPGQFLLAAYARFLECAQSTFPEVGFVASTRGAMVGRSRDGARAASLQFTLLYPGSRLRDLPGRSIRGVFAVSMTPDRFRPEKLREITLAWRNEAKPASFQIAGYHPCGGVLSSRRHPKWEMCLRSLDPLTPAQQCISDVLRAQWAECLSADQDESYVCSFALFHTASKLKLRLCRGRAGCGRVCVPCDVGGHPPVPDLDEVYAGALRASHAGTLDAFRSGLFMSRPSSGVASPMASGRGSPVPSNADASEADPPASVHAEDTGMLPPDAPSLEQLGNRLHDILLDVLVDTSSAPKICGMLIENKGRSIARFLTADGRDGLLECVAEAEAALRAESERVAREEAARAAVEVSARAPTGLYVPPHLRRTVDLTPRAPGDGRTADERANRRGVREDDRESGASRSRDGSEAGD